MSPAEPEFFYPLGELKKYPETVGADFFLEESGFALQRKEIRDFIASVNDGRLNKEVNQMLASDEVSRGVFIIEGRWTWEYSEAANDLMWLDTRNNIQSTFSYRQLIGLLCSIQDRGCWVLSTASKEETRRTILQLDSWAQKDKHLSLSRRPKLQGEWGYVTNEDWRSWWWQTWDDIGPELGGRLAATLGIPVTWAIEYEVLRAVPGIGDVKARKIWEGLGGVVPEKVKRKKKGER